MSEEPLESPSPTGVRSEDKLWIVLTHLSVLIGVGIILPLVVYLVMKDERPVVAANAKEALNFHISLFIYAIIGVILTMIAIGVLILIAISLGALVLSIVAAVKSVETGAYRYPLTIRLIK